ncbi:MAG: glycosyltransferase family 2 protein [Rhodospirillales bacterium]
MSETASFAGFRVAVLVPCYNEEKTIADVVRGFRAALPTAAIYVYDNNSRDRTVELARAAGAVVRTETLQGKGNVVRRMFADIEADIYVMADGDNTYHAPSAPALIEKLLGGKLDMVVGSRVDNEQSAYRPGHRFGNKVLTGFVARLFGERFGDILSGYRVFSRRYVKSFPALAKGFETETELTVHALELRMPVAELPTPYGARPQGSASKLNTWRDGFRILMQILRLFREERPLQFFLFWFAALITASIALGTPVVIEFLRTGLVPRLPTAVLATGIMLLAFLSLMSGLILDTVTRGRRELRRLAYLAIPGLDAPDDRAKR